MSQNFKTPGEIYRRRLDYNNNEIKQIRKRIAGQKFELLGLSKIDSVNSQAEENKIECAIGSSINLTVDGEAQIERLRKENAELIMWYSIISGEGSMCDWKSY